MKPINSLVTALEKLVSGDALTPDEVTVLCRLGRGHIAKNRIPILRVPGGFVYGESLIDDIDGAEFQRTIVMQQSVDASSVYTGDLVRNIGLLHTVGADGDPCTWNHEGDDDDDEDLRCPQGCSYDPAFSRENMRLMVADMRTLEACAGDLDEQQRELLKHYKTELNANTRYGRIKNQGDEAEGHYRNVYRSLVRFWRVLQPLEPDLTDYLRRHTRTGRTCRFTGDPKIFRFN